MQTHKFITRSARDAVAKIQTELGPNAVVLDVRKLPRRFFRRQEFEITATIQEHRDPLEELRAEIRELKERMPLQPSLSLLRPLLIESGLLPKFADRIADKIADDDLSLQDQIESARHYLRSSWRRPQSLDSRYHVFIGPPGSGKSTVLCKWLTHHVLSENRGAAVLQLDTHIANLSPQPRLFAEILGAPFSRTAMQPDAEVVFVDLPGIDLADHNGFAATREVIAGLPHASLHLVLNAAYETTLLLDQAKLFAALNPIDLILTHLDEEPRWGKLWNLIFGTNFSIRSLSLGQNVPAGLQPATAEGLLEQQFGGKRPVSRSFEAGKPSAKHRSEFVGR